MSDLVLGDKSVWGSTVLKIDMSCWRLGLVGGEFDGDWSSMSLRHLQRERGVALMEGGGRGDGGGDDVLCCLDSVHQHLRHGCAGRVVGDVSALTLSVSWKGALSGPGDGGLESGIIRTCRFWFGFLGSGSSTLREESFDIGESVVGSRMGCGLGGVSLLAGSMS